MSSLNDCIKFHFNIEDRDIIFSDYLKKYINDKYHNLYVAELIQPHCPYCLFSNLKHNGHYTSNVRFVTADASHTVIIKLKKQHVYIMLALKDQWLNLILLIKAALLSSTMILLISLNT